MNRLVALFAVVIGVWPLVGMPAEPNILGSNRLALMEDPLAVVFRDGAGSVAPSRMRQAIMGAAQANGWSVVKEAEGQVELTTTVRDTHVVALNIFYTSTGYEIRYLQSGNLNYEEQRRGSVVLRAIHRNYNVWIRTLADSINAIVSESAKIVATKPATSMVTNTNFAPIRKIRLPHLSDDADAEDAYKRFLGSPVGRAFAIAPNGAFGWSVRSSSKTWGLGGEAGDPVKNALRHCNRKGKGRCRLYAVDDVVVWWDE